MRLNLIVWLQYATLFIKLTFQVLLSSIPTCFNILFLPPNNTFQPYYLTSQHRKSLKLYRHTHTLPTRCSSPRILSGNRSATTFAQKKVSRIYVHMKFNHKFLFVPLRAFFQADKRRNADLSPVRPFLAEPNHISSRRQMGPAVHRQWSFGPMVSVVRVA